jgi:hypothetical protein
VLQNYGEFVAKLPLDHPKLVETMMLRNSVGIYLASGLDHGGFGIAAT